MKKDINMIILEHIKTDDSYNTNSNDRIMSVYNNANDTQKELIDDIFISLCGYSLDTIIKQVRQG